MVTHRFLPLMPSIKALAQHGVIGKPRAAESASKHDCLLGSWVKPKSIRTLGVHLQTISAVCPKSNALAKRRGCGRDSRFFKIQEVKKVQHAIAHHHSHAIARGNGSGNQKIAFKDEKKGTASLSALSLPALKGRVSRTIK